MLKKSARNWNWLPRFADREGLEERHIPIVTTGATYGVVAQIAPSARRGRREGTGAEPLVNRVRVGNRSETSGRLVQLGTTLQTLFTPLTVPLVVMFIGAPDNGLNDSRNLPAADNRLHETIG